MGPYARLETGHFPASELVVVPGPSRPVILKSGGPIMDLLHEEGGVALCEWDDGRSRFPVACLYRLVPMAGD